MVQINQLLLAALATLTGLTTAAPQLNQACRECYTYTETQTPQCPERTRCGPRPMCLMLSTTTIPGPDPNCPATPTVTKTLDCPIPCPTGCGTSVTTVTAKAPYCPISKTSLTPPASSAPPAPLPEPGTSGRCPAPQVIVPEADYCPGFGLDCMRLMCIRVETLTVDAACATAVFTATPSCVRDCKPGCFSTTVVVTRGMGPATGMAAMVTPAPAEMPSEMS